MCQLYRENNRMIKKEKKKYSGFEENTEKNNSKKTFTLVKDLNVELSNK